MVKRTGFRYQGLGVTVRAALLLSAFCLLPAILRGQATPQKMQSAFMGNGVTTLDASTIATGDCGAKINAQEAALGSAAGSILVTPVCGLTWTTPVVISNSSHVLSIFPGSYAIAGITISGTSSGVAGAGVGLFGATTVLTAANSAALSAVITLSGADTFVRGVYVNGNISGGGTSSSGVGIYVYKANRFDIQDVTVQNAGSHGMSVYSTSSNESCCGKVSHSMSEGNLGSGFYAVNTGDIFIGGGSEFEANSRYGLELNTVGSMRLEHSDIGGNSLGGIYDRATGPAGRNIVDGNQFGNNLGPDIDVLGWYGGGYVITGYQVVGNGFIGAGGAITTNTYDSVHIVDSINTVVAGNHFDAGGTGHVFRYGLYIGNASTSDPGDTVTGNTFGVAVLGQVFGTSACSILSTTAASGNVGAPCLQPPVAVASLPACSASTLLARLFVNNATSATPGTTAAGGGTYTVAAECIFNSSGSTYTWIVD